MPHFRSRADSVMQTGSCSIESSRSRLALPVYRAAHGRSKLRRFVLDLGTQISCALPKIINGLSHSLARSHSLIVGICFSSHSCLLLESIANFKRERKMPLANLLSATRRPRLKVQKYHHIAPEIC